MPATYLRMIKFSHSVFALPFAFTAALIASGGIPPLDVIFWITMAMVGARTGAMGFNRIIDRAIDSKNPRTSGREIPARRVGVPEAVVFSSASFGVLIFAAYKLNPLCFYLSPLAIALTVGYSYTKRFTWGAHFFLGLAIASAPIGAWIAIRGTLEWEALLLGMAVLTWLAGFDILYALQDIEFDRIEGLYSIPARFGIKASLRASAFLHLLTICFLLGAGIVFSMGWPYWAGMTVVAGLFVYEHSLLKPGDLSRLDMAFFNMNGYISFAVFASALLNYLVN